MDTKVEDPNSAKLLAASAGAAITAQTVCEAIDDRIVQYNRDIAHLLKLRDSLPLNVLAMPAFQLRHLAQRF